MKIAAVTNTTVNQTWNTASGEAATVYSFPDGTQISPVTLGWSSGQNKVVEVVPFVPPSGKQITGSPSYQIVSNKAVETYAVEDIPAPESLPYVRMFDIYTRLTGDEAAQYDAAWEAAGARERGLYNSAPNGVMRFDSEWYPDFRAVVVSLFGESRTVQLLAPSETPI